MTNIQNANAIARTSFANSLDMANHHLERAESAANAGQRPIMERHVDTAHFYADSMARAFTSTQNLKDLDTVMKRIKALKA